jgi:predicted nucleic acid-binding protein
MISADTSVMIAYFQGLKGKDIAMVEEALSNKNLIFTPMVVAELLSDAKLSMQSIKAIISFPMMEISHGYWHRVGFTRAKILSKKLKAKLVDTQIAQLCIENNVSLITRDSDFRHFEKYCGLKLIISPK